MRVCCRCRAELEEGAPRTRKYCLPCWRDYSREYRKRAPEKARAAVEKWRKAHPEEIRVAMAKWRRANPDRVRAINQRWYAANGAAWREQHAEKLRVVSRERMRVQCRTERFKALKRAWHAKNAAQVNAKRREKRERDPEGYRAKERARYERDKYKRVMSAERARARRSGAEGSHTVAEWKSVLRHYARRCVYCGVRLTNATISKDHKVPLCRGGSNSIHNIVPACRACNSRKHTRTAAEFSKHLPITS